MAMDIDSARKALAAVARGLAGIRGVEDYPAGSPLQAPFAVALPGHGEATGISDGWLDNDMWTRVFILSPAEDMARCIQELAPYGDLFLKAVIADPTLNGAVEGVDRITWSFGPVTYAFIEYLGWTFDIHFTQTPTL
jgi:hypothetical protein